MIDEIGAIQFKNDNELVQIREIRGKKTNWCVYPELFGSLVI